MTEYAEIEERRQDIAAQSVPENKEVENADVFKQKVKRYVDTWLSKVYVIYNGHNWNIDKLNKENRILGMPINYLRGINWNSKYIIGDEFQNCSRKELITIMTRLGEFSKLIMCADPDQADIGNKTGYMSMLNLFDDVDSQEHGIYVFRFDDKDVVRSGLCKYLLYKFKEFLLNWPKFKVFFVPNPKLPMIVLPKAFPPSLNINVYLPVVVAPALRSIFFSFLNFSFSLTRLSFFFSSRAYLSFNSEYLDDKLSFSIFHFAFSFSSSNNKEPFLPSASLKFFSRSDILFL